jgi:hypothetical protein
MRKVIVNDWMTLGGVIQAPGGDREDQTADSPTAAGTWLTPATGRPPPVEPPLRQREPTQHTERES